MTREQWYVLTTVAPIMGVITFIAMFVAVIMFAREADDLRRRCICPVEATGHEIRD